MYMYLFLHCEDVSFILSWNIIDVFGKIDRNYQTFKLIRDLLRQEIFCVYSVRNMMLEI